METICKNFEKCPIYNGILKEINVDASRYKKQYCDAGILGWNKCKRYIVKEKYGTCPSDLLPNSFKDVDAIMASMI